MKRRRSILAWVAVGSVLAGAASGCDGGGSAEAVSDDDLAQQIQRELDAAAISDPATAARTRTVRPVVTCVDNLGGNHFQAHFGYLNSAASPVSIPVGFFNRFWPPPLKRGQPTTLIAGAQVDVVQVPFDGFRAVIWVLGNHFAIATRFSRHCPASGASGGQSGAGGTGAGGTGGIGGIGSGGRGVGGMGVGGQGTGGRGVDGPGGQGVGGQGTGGAVPPRCPSSCDDHDVCTVDVCDNETLQCLHFAALDGTSCTDGNACTLIDTCQAGVCVGSSGIVCAARDSCHRDGVCDPITGACSNPTVPDGTQCPPTSTCDQAGTCEGGVCLPPAGARCSLACSQCSFGVPAYVDDVCSFTTAGCSNCVSATDGCAEIADPLDRALCEDLYACLIAPTHPGTSIPGPCLLGGNSLPCWCGTNSSTCATDDTPPTQANGPCLRQFLAAGKSSVAARISERLIDPGYPLGRAVNLAACQGTSCASECQLVEPCPASDSCHRPGDRDPITGLCSDAPPAPDGAACSDGDECTVGDRCQAGVCVSGPDCPLSDDCQQASSCEFRNFRNECVLAYKPDGTTCAPSLACAAPGVCRSGVCQLPQLPECSACEECSFGPLPGQTGYCSLDPHGCYNCDATTDGCQGIANPVDRALCESLYACLVAPTHPGSTVPGPCDPLRCWCGTNATTCATSNAPPTQANGPCLQQVFAAAKTQDAETINHRLTEPAFPLGRAINLANCQAAHCVAECRIPF